MEEFKCGGEVDMGKQAKKPSRVSASMAPSRPTKEPREPRLESVASPSLTTKIKSTIPRVKG